MTLASEDRQADLAAAVPAELRDADQLLMRYGRWATMAGRGGAPHTMDRMYIREADRKESLEAYQRRRAHLPSEPLLRQHEALHVQRVLVGVPFQERIVLHLLYLPDRRPIAVRLRKLNLRPRQCRERHLAGLRMFDRLWRAAPAVAR